MLWDLFFNLREVVFLFFFNLKRKEFNVIFLGRLKGILGDIWLVIFLKLIFVEWFVLLKRFFSINFNCLFFLNVIFKGSLLMLKILVIKICICVGFFVLFWWYLSFVLWSWMSGFLSIVIVVVVLIIVFILWIWNGDVLNWRYVF